MRSHEIAHIMEREKNLPRKAELTTEMMLGLIAVAIIIVLAIVILSGKISFFSKNSDCSAQGGKCELVADCGNSVLYSASCADIGGKPAVCCINQGGSS